MLQTASALIRQAVSFQTFILTVLIFIVVLRCLKWFWWNPTETADVQSSVCFCAYVGGSSQGRDMQVCLWDLSEGRSNMVDSVWTGSAGFCQSSMLERSPGSSLLAFAGKETEEVRLFACALVLPWAFKGLYHNQVQIKGVRWTLACFSHKWEESYFWMSDSLYNNTCQPLPVLTGSWLFLAIHICGILSYLLALSRIFVCMFGVQNWLNHNKSNPSSFVTA